MRESWRGMRGGGYRSLSLPARGSYGNGRGRGRGYARTDVNAVAHPWGTGIPGTGHVCFIINLIVANKRSFI